MEPLKSKAVNYVTSDDFVSAPTSTTVEFNRNGLDVENSETAFAKILSDTESKKDTFFVMEVNSSLHDPIGPYSSRGSRLDGAKFAKVSKDVFDLYIAYLKTNNSVYLSKAQRGFLNG